MKENYPGKLLKFSPKLWVKCVVTHAGKAGGESDEEGPLGIRS